MSRQIGTNDFSQEVVATVGLGALTARTDYPVESGPMFDIGGGILFTSQIGVGVAFTRSSQSENASLFGEIPDPVFVDNLASDTATEVVNRTENGIHISMRGVVPVNDRLSVSFYAGPSRISVTQGIVVDFEATQVADPLVPNNTLTISGATAILELGDSAWGFNGGVDVAFFFSDIVGVGGGVRFTRATVEFENLLRSTFDNTLTFVKSDAGGVQLTAGVRLRFP